MNNYNNRTLSVPVFYTIIILSLMPGNTFCQVETNGAADVESWSIDDPENGQSSSAIRPEAKSSKIYQDQPLAQGSPKFLGNVKNYNDDHIFAHYWNQLTPENEGKWGSVAITTDTARWNWRGLDVLYKYAKEHNLIFKDHTLIWGNQQPSWISNLNTSQQLMYIEFWFRKVGQRYPEMDMIDVVNEPLAGHNPPDGNSGRADYKTALGGDGDTGWDWVINSFKLARKYMPNTKLLLNDYGIINDNSATTSYLQIINLLKERELIDGIGVQGHRFELERANLNTLRYNLDRLAATGLPIYISEMDLGNINNAGTPDDDQQLLLYQRIFPVLWEHPGVKGITLWGYIEGRMWQSTCYLVRTDGTWRPAMAWLDQYIEEYIEKTVPVLPSNFILEQNYPNPFNPKTTIKFSMLRSVKISLKIYDILGREIAILVNDNLPADDYTVTWDATSSDGSKAASGIYFYSLVAGNTVITKKMLLVK